MSCGWACADLSNLLRPAELDLKLAGGSPKADIKIKDEDVRTKRTTFMGKMGKLFGSKVESILKIKVIPNSRLPPKVVAGLEMLPKRGMYKINSINMSSVFRGYLGEWRFF